MLVLVISEISHPSCEVATSLATTLELPIINAFGMVGFGSAFHNIYARFVVVLEH